MLPEQVHAVGELAGEYNTLAFDSTPANGSIHMTSSTLSIDAAEGDGPQLCDDLRVCVAATTATLPNVTFSSNAAGGFDLNNTTAGDVRRVFAYRAGGGELMLVALANAGHITFMTRNVPVAATLWARSATLEPLPGFNLHRARCHQSLEKHGDVRGQPRPARTRELRCRTSAPLQRGRKRCSSTAFAGLHAPTRAGDRSAQRRQLFHSVRVHRAVMRGMDMSVLALPASNQFGISPLESSSN